MNVLKYSPILFAPDAPAAAAPAAAADVPAPDTSGGQGNEATTSGLYSLDSVPEAIRGQVEPHFKEWDASVTREFQKRAEQWAPYEELGIRDIDPEDLGHLKSFYEIASDPDKFSEWVANAYESLGLGAEGEPAGTPGEPEAGAAGDEDRPLTRAEAEALYEERETAREQEAEAQRIHDEISSEISSTFDELGVKDEEDQELIAFLAQKLHADDKSVGDALREAHAAWQKKLGKVESDALDEKLKQPAPAENAGAAHSAPKAATSFSEAGDRLRERLRASRGT